MNLEDYVENQNFNDATNIDNAKNSNVSLTEESIEKEKRIQKEKESIESKIDEYDQKWQSNLLELGEYQEKKKQYEALIKKVDSSKEYISKTLDYHEQTKDLCKEMYCDKSEKSLDENTLKYYQYFYLGKGLVTSFKSSLKSVKSYLESVRTDVRKQINKIDDVILTDQSRNSYYEGKIEEYQAKLDTLSN